MFAAPLSLYIDLDPGGIADWDAVARASLAFTAGVREVAAAFDPSAQFKIELESGDQGSLWLKARLRWIRGNYFPQATLQGIAWTSVVFFSGGVANYSLEHGLDWIFSSGEAETVRLSQDQINEITVKVAIVTRDEAGREQFASVYQELGRDPAIRGVGAAPTHREKPRMIVPRREFALRSELDPAPTANAPDRRRITRGDLVIVKAVLKPGGGSWRLRSSEGEISATMADDNFWSMIVGDGAQVPFGAEIHIDADLETIEERTDEGAWKPAKRTILRVYQIKRGFIQQRLFEAPE